MRNRNNDRTSQIRERIAQEAARVMIEGGTRDFNLAKRKAMARLRVSGNSKLPGNDEVERAIESYQRLFLADRQPGQLNELRHAALRAMEFLTQFKPRLVGPVLTGTADKNSNICLHVFAQTAEDVTLFLMENGIEHEPAERRLKMGAAETVRMPAFRFLADGRPIELVVFPDTGRRHPPLSPIDGRPMRRANLAEVASLAVTDEG
ncbi:MAG: hypothetical protein OER43_12605 [Gammaproteobacteria bacterium]|nr:hypothetical protein [Gammaproteobacteria bacterium]MDH3411909.1 hypothetical protein [Gammaproteobacteria bacterium]